MCKEFKCKRKRRKVRRVVSVTDARKTSKKLNQRAESALKSREVDKRFLKMRKP